MCDLFVSKCSAKVYGTGKQWPSVLTTVVNTHRYTHAATCAHTWILHHALPSLPKLWKTKPRRGRNVQSRCEHANAFPQWATPALPTTYCRMCVRGIHDLFTWEREIWGIQYRWCQNDGLNGHQREKVREFVWWCMLREHFSGGTVFDPHRLVNPYVSCPAKASPVKTPSQTLLRISEPNY